MRYVILFQGVYYLFTGLWPLIHLRSFEKVTGNKKDHWLVYTVSLLILASSMVFLYASLIAKNITTETLILSLSYALFLGFVSIYFPAKGVIRKVYLGDGLAEFLIVAGVILCGI